MEALERRNVKLEILVDFNVFVIYHSKMINAILIIIDRFPF